MNTTAHVSLVEGARFDEPNVRALPEFNRRPVRLLPPGDPGDTLTGSPPLGRRGGHQPQSWDWLAWRLDHPVTLPSPLNDVA